jgi:hypothetical protein
MPTSLMYGLQSSTSNVENQNRMVPHNLTRTSVMSLRQQMDESNHEMINLLTQQLGTVIDPLIQDLNNSYQMLTNQMSRIAYFFGAPPTQQQQIRPIPTQAPVQRNQMPNE